LEMEVKSMWVEKMMKGEIMRVDFHYKNPTHLLRKTVS
jgi:hypothetical protein